MAWTFDLSETFVHLAAAGGAEPVRPTPSFWRCGVDAPRYERILGAIDFTSAGDLHPSMQEVHPEADEVLLVVSGALDVVLEEAGVERTITLLEGQAVIVPRGIWHRLVLRRPGRLLFINSRTGMKSRAARPGREARDAT